MPYLDLVPIIVMGLYLLVELICKGRFGITLLRFIFLLPSLVDMQVVRFWKRIFPPAFPIVGQCHMCGRCCINIVGDPPDFIKHNRWLLGLYIAFHSTTHNFEPFGRGPDDEVMFKCRYLGPDHLCRNYRLRPRICRDYPFQYWFEEPVFIKGCGHRVKLKDGIKERQKEFSDREIAKGDSDQKNDDSGRAHDDSRHDEQK
jgi:Fe-S-cluster containining protein